MQQPPTFDLDAYRRSMAEVIGTAPETQVFWDALDFACEAHKDQRRRSGEPYIIHPCAVARILASELDIRSSELLAAALLHDTIEDVDTVDGPLIRAKFGPTVEAIVEGCTKITRLKPQNRRERQTHKKRDHRKIFSGAAARPEVMLVKLADRLHNLRTLASMDRARRTRIAEETLDIYAPLATILGLYDIKREMYNLALSYRFPHKSKPIRTHIRALQSDPQALAVVERIRDGLAAHGLAAEVTLRTRDLWAYYDAKKRTLKELIEHPQTIVIQVESREACYTALGVLNNLYPPTPRSIRDFIANPKRTGYQGLHARPNINGLEYLIKIRTEEMSLKARRGLINEWERRDESGRRFFEEIQQMFDVMGRDESVSYRELIATSDRKDIYTYTTEGTLVRLPSNSTVLDFAFCTEPELGHSCIGAMIGQRWAGPTEILKDGDTVRVLRGETPFLAPEILALCKTHQALSNLSDRFRTRREEVSRSIGDSLLHQELRRYGIPREVLNGDGMAEVLASFGLAAMPDLHLALGEGRLRLGELVTAIRDRLWAGHPTLLPPTGELNQVVLNTVDPVVMKMSACCRPSPLDKGVIGLLSERGLSLHRHDCPQLSQVHFSREEAVEVRWKLAETLISKPQRLLIMQTDRARLFEVLAAAPKEMRLAELIHLGQSAAAEGDWELSFRVNTLRGLKKSVHHFERAGLPFEFELEA